MSLIKAAILPHSPLLIPDIGRSNHSFLDKTTLAYEQIKEQLKQAAVETLIVISPHGLSDEEAFTLNIAPELTISFQDFGYIPPKTIINGDVILADQIINQLRSKFKIQLSSESALDYGTAVPIYLLKSLDYNFRVITITPAKNLKLEDYYNFGRALQNIIKASPKKIAVVSSSDLSHRLKKKSPGGYSPKGAKFDNKLIEYLNNPKTAAANILKMDEKLIGEAGECGLKSIIILLGVMAGLPTEAKILAYQTDFGVGYLSLEFKILSEYGK